jgi:hypothetical protein
VVLAAGFLCRAASSGAAHPARPAPTRGPVTRPIETLRVGDRVAADNPEADDQARQLPDPDPATWRRLTLRVDRPRVCRFDVELLRPVAWVEAAHAAVGRSVRLRLPEMGLDDPADVLAVGPCPAIRPGGGRVVTGTFAHEAPGGLLDVAVEGLAGPLGCTRGHPFWSEDRHGFVFAERLRPGEHLRAREGLRRVQSVTARPGGARVYNLEVDAQHVYHVTGLGILVHNSSPPPPDPPHLVNRGSPPDPANEGIVQATTETQFMRDGGRYVDSNGYPLDGTYKVVVMPDGSVRYMPSYAGTHAELAGGGPVRAAGEIEFSDGLVGRADITSGHYQPGSGQGYDGVLDAGVRGAGYDGPPISDTHE